MSPRVQWVNTDSSGLTHTSESLLFYNKHYQISVSMIFHTYHIQHMMNHYNSFLWVKRVLQMIDRSPPCLDKNMLHDWLPSLLWNIIMTYCQTSFIRGNKSQNLNVSRLILQLSLHKLLKSSVKSRMEMQLEQRRQAMLQLHLRDQLFHCPIRSDLYQRFEVCDFLCFTAT